jgi:hypothetical protein
VDFSLFFVSAGMKRIAGDDKGLLAISMECVQLWALATQVKLF